MRTFGGLSAENHFGMIDKILVDSEIVLIESKVYPIGFYFNGAVTLLQKQNVRYNLCARIYLKSIVGQSDRTEQFGSLCDIFADIGRFLIHRIA